MAERLGVQRQRQERSQEDTEEFYKYVRHGNADKGTPIPQAVSWIDTSIKKNEQVESGVITEEEAKREWSMPPLRSGTRLS